ncbi:unnamed protein product [Staurois parvus]|uniref:Uncharacterized protein n=1 Tax=Staurois parvus TaxID=386267 RepID=A0ABN9F9J7_9NEOB|nr:unnamed protein product [Staurois parvus]
MSLLQCPRQCNPADADDVPPADASICLLGTIPCDVGTYGGREI